MAWLIISTRLKKKTKKNMTEAQVETPIGLRIQMFKNRQKTMTNYKKIMMT